MVQRLELGPLGPRVEARLARLQGDDAIGRLWRRDAGLFSDDPGVQATVGNRLGWLDCFDAMAGELPRVQSFVSEMIAEGYQQALLLGMGGSSLCPEVLSLTFGRTAPGLDVRVLDSTHPDSVRAARDWAAAHKTLFIVASKSGGTIEVASFREFFSQGAAQGSFVAITDPGSPLESLAQQAPFRAAFLNPSDVGGRFSALTLFGLVPAALLNIDAQGLLESGRAMAERCSAAVPAAENEAAVLGVVLAEAAREGRDKLTLIADEDSQFLGRWIEQLVAESTGKEGLGVLPVDGETLLPVSEYSADRLFVVMRGKGGPSPVDAPAAELAAAGHPVVHLGWQQRTDLGGEFFRWELATSVCGAVLGINPFDEPNVKEAKDRTGEVLVEFTRTGALSEPTVSADEPPLRMSADPELHASSCELNGVELLRAHLDRVQPGDYVALQAYLRAEGAARAELQELRSRLGARTKAATTLGIGPRFLHSTGQLHKGGPNRGVFLQLVHGADEDLEIPGKDYGFDVLCRAQALGDFQALEARDRRVLRIELHGDPVVALRQLIRQL